MAPFRSMFPANGTVCAACGCGDNTIGHWTRWCIVPLLVACILAQPGHSWATLNDIAVTSRRTATICTLVIAAFRRLLRQEGAFVHQARGEPKSVAWWCDTLIESTCQDATKELGVPLMHPRTKRIHCLLHSQLIDTVCASCLPKLQPCTCLQLSILASKTVELVIGWALLRLTASTVPYFVRCVILHRKENRMSILSIYIILTRTRVKKP